MRFSLLTLFWVCLLSGSIVGIFLRPARWVLDAKSDASVLDPLATQLLRDGLQKSYADPDHPYSWRFMPDRRHAVLAIGERALLIFGAEDELLYKIDSRPIEEALQQHVNTFKDQTKTNYDPSVRRELVVADADTLYVGNRYVDEKRQLFMGRCFAVRRLYPEYWWGHLCRFEFWTAVFSALGLVWTLIRFVNSRRRKHPNLGNIGRS